MQTATKKHPKRMRIETVENLRKRQLKRRRVLLVVSFLMFVGAYFSSTPQRAIALASVGILGGLTSQRRL